MSETTDDIEREQERAQEVEQQYGHPMYCPNQRCPFVPEKPSNYRPGDLCPECGWEMMEA